MPTLLIRFPARRYHATPWGHHVNEGQIEWPPSPWRLLRALLSIGYTSGMWDGNGPPTIARTLFEKMASVLPTFHLPPACGTHSRHYMPTGKLNDNGLPVTTLVFDTWAHVVGKGLAVTWDVVLTEEESSLLSSLAERLGYLGRSESWVEVRLLAANESMPEGERCVPSDGPPPPGWEQIVLLAPQKAEDFLKWRQEAKELLFRPSPGENAKVLKKRIEKEMLAYPEDLIAALQSETGWLHKHGWSQPPGSRRVFYHRRIGALESGAPRPSFRALTPPPVQFILLSMTAPGNNNHILPPVIQTLPKAELFHRALTKRVNRHRLACPVITGCDERKNPLKGSHEHAHLLPLDLDGDGHIDHLLVHAKAGLDGTAQAIVRKVRRIHAKGKDLVEPLCLAVVGYGGIEDLRQLPGEYGRRLCAVFGPEGGSRRWSSITPFIAPRYLKTYGRNTLAGQVAAELASRGYPAPAEVRVIEPGKNIEYLKHRHFIRIRRRGPKPPVDFGYTLELSFEKPISGPLSLGYASHFGMGLFAAVKDK